jgi:hypothetical protein
MIGQRLLGIGVPGNGGGGLCPAMGHHRLIIIITIAYSTFSMTELTINL